MTAPGSTLGATTRPVKLGSWNVLAILTSTGWVALGLGLAGLAVGAFTNFRELAVLGLALLLALLLAGGWMSLQPVLRIERMLDPSRVVESEPVTARLTVTNVGRRRTTPIMVDERFGSSSIPVPIESLGSGQERVISYHLPTRRRGRYRVGPLTIAHTDPLRLMRVSRAQGAVVSLYVVPRYRRVAPLPTGRLRDLEGIESARTAADGLNFHSLREYVPGDDLRQIHWPSTARSGTYMVRQNLVTFEPRSLILLDTRRASYESADRFDDAVRVAASLIQATITARREVQFATTAMKQLIDIDTLHNGRTDVFDALAEATLHDGDPSLSALARHVDAGIQPVSLGLVSGVPRPQSIDLIGRAVSRFDSVSLVQIAPPGTQLAVNGALVLRCDTVDDFANRWKAAVE